MSVTPSPATPVGDTRPLSKAQLEEIFLADAPTEHDPLAAHIGYSLAVASFLRPEQALEKALLLAMIAEQCNVPEQDCLDRATAYRDRLGDRITAARLLQTLTPQ